MDYRVSQYRLTWSDGVAAPGSRTGPIIPSGMPRVNTHTRDIRLHQYRSPILPVVPRYRFCIIDKTDIRSLYYQLYRDIGPMSSVILRYRPCIISYIAISSLPDRLNRYDIPILTKIYRFEYVLVFVHTYISRTKIVVSRCESNVFCCRSHVVH